MPDNLPPLSAAEMDALERKCKAWMPSQLAEMGLRAIHQIRELTERVADLDAQKAIAEVIERDNANYNRAEAALDRVAALEERVAGLEADKARLDWLEQHAIQVHDPESGKLIFFRTVGARPLREYVDETRAAIDATPEARP